MSLAVARAAADELDLPLYRYVGGVNAHVLPVPMMNVLNGGAHADNNVDLQEFMVMPVGAASFSRGPALGGGDLPRAQGAAARAGSVHRRGRRGRVRPQPGRRTRTRVAAAGRGHRAGRLHARATRSPSPSTSASTEFYEDGRYRLDRRGPELGSAGFADYLADLCDRYPIVSIEDGMAEDDWDGWAALTAALGDRVQLVGDDLFVTNVERLGRGIDAGVANSILVKVNQIGTLTETLDTMALATARPATRAVMSHRSGETEDTTIADLAVATNCGQIKTGAPARSDRVAKYNQLLRIEEDLGESAAYPRLFAR